MNKVVDSNFCQYPSEVKFINSLYQIIESIYNYTNMTLQVFIRQLNNKHPDCQTQQFQRKIISVVKSLQPSSLSFPFLQAVVTTYGLPITIHFQRLYDLANRY